MTRWRTLYIKISPSIFCLRYLYIAQVTNQEYRRLWIHPFLDSFDYINEFWGYFWFPDAIKISTDSWNDVLHDLIIYVSRSGKFTAFYIAYISHIGVNNVCWPYCEKWCESYIGWYTWKYTILGFYIIDKVTIRFVWHFLTV